METISFETALGRLNISELTPKVQRECKPVNTDVLLRAIYSIGKAICPKFTIDDDNQDTLLALGLWTMGLPFKAKNPVTKMDTEGRPDRGIYLVGPTGTGKTLAMQIMYYLAKMRGMRIKVASSEYTLQWKGQRAEDLCDEYCRTGEMGSIKGQPVICVNDLGCEPKETMYMGNRVEVMRQLIERWGDRQDRLLLFTSNLPMCYDAQTEAERRMDTVYKRYGPRVESRLVEMCNYLYLGGEDRRLAI